MLLSSGLFRMPDSKKNTGNGKRRTFQSYKIKQYEHQSNPYQLQNSRNGQRWLSAGDQPPGSDDGRLFIFTYSKEAITALSEDKKKMIASTVETLKQLDEISLRIILSNCEILKARDAMDKQDSERVCEAKTG